MSKFYEAMRQASESLHGSDAKAGLPDAYIASLDEPAVMKEDAVSAFSDMGPPTFSLEAAIAEATAPKPQNGSFGMSVETMLDNEARLIPNSKDPMTAEYYKALRTKIMERRSENMFQSLLVTSAEPKEGKTVTVLNLALAFGLLPGFKLLVVDGDIRKGQVSRLLGVDGKAGLGNLLEGTVRLEEVILRSSHIPFSFMSRGNSKIPAPELLHSSRWSTEGERLRENFDLILVDSPPVSAVTDAPLLANGCEAVLLVARAFVTSREALENARRELPNIRVIGTVLNGEPGLGSYRRYGAYHS